MTKRFLVFCYIILLFTACKKEEVRIINKSAALTEWLMSNCKYSVAEVSTGTIVFDVSEISMDGKIISQRGIYYFKPNPDPKLLFPAIKEVSSAGYSRDIEIGTSTTYCADYRTQTGTVDVTMIVGEKTFTWTNCPVALLEHETLPVINWTVNIPKQIDIRLKPAGK